MSAGLPRKPRVGPDGVAQYTFSLADYERVERAASRPRQPPGARTPGCLQPHLLELVRSFEQRSPVLAPAPALPPGEAVAPAAGGVRGGCRQGPRPTEHAPVAPEVPQPPQGGDARPRQAGGGGGGGAVAVGADPRGAPSDAAAVPSRRESHPPCLSPTLRCWRDVINLRCPPALCLVAPQGVREGLKRGGRLLLADEMGVRPL